MSETQQTPNNMRTSVILIIAAIIVGVGWFAWQQSKDDTKKETKDTAKQSQRAETPSKTDEYKGWKSYTWASQGVTFKYPGDWFIKENTSLKRLYVKNSQVDLATEETPANFQQVWLSADQDEAAVARENDIKKGVSAFREVNGTVKASIIKAGDTTINVYAYDTIGGPTIEAYWTNKAGTRLYATNSTEVGQQNQTDMVATLQKILASITLQ